MSLSFQLFVQFGFLAPPHPAAFRHALVGVIGKLQCVAITTHPFPHLLSVRIHNLF
jgi:hypothetical protein